MRPATLPVLVALVLGACAPDRALPPAGGGQPDGGSLASTGLPCDVAELLAAKCSGCHGAAPRYDAPMSLVTYDDLLKPTPSNPTVSAVVESAARMRSTDPTRVMPPGRPPAAEELAILENWISAGTPKGTCDSTTTDGGSPWGEPVPDSPPGCETNVYWTRGDDGSASMHPGVACIQCHLREGEDEAPTVIAGTVYDATHEFDDCYGTRGATVEITDATGKVINLGTNGAGNFFYERAIALPYTARVLRDGRVRAMIAPQQSGDCNACHTENGAEKAPGRIVAP